MPGSTWVPPKDKLPEEIHLLIHKDNEDFKNHFKFYRETPNLSQREVRVLRELINSKHIVIKPADKGSAVVIQGRDQYILEVQRQLNDSVYHKKLDKSIYAESIPIIHQILDKLHTKKFIIYKAKKSILKEI